MKKTVLLEAPYLLTGLWLRLGLGLVYLYSGYSKLFAGEDAIGVCSNKAEAAAMVATYAWFPFDPEQFVLVQSWLEIILGLMLILGIKTRWMATISALLIVLFFLMINWHLVWKNMALLGASLALAVTRDNWLSIDDWWQKRKNQFIN
mgnify:CR=1 FL=1